MSLIFKNLLLGIFLSGVCLAKNVQTFDDQDALARVVDEGQANQADLYRSYKKLSSEQEPRGHMTRSKALKRGQLATRGALHRSLRMPARDLTTSLR